MPRDALVAEIAGAERPLALRELCEAREDGEAVEIAFRALFRLSRDESERPKYPEFNWELAEHWAYDYPVE